MKTLLIVILTCMLAASAFASGDLARVSSALQFGGQPAQFFAPEVTTVLTVNSTTVDMTNYILYAVNPLAVATCYERRMPAANSVKANYPLSQFPVSTVHIRAKSYVVPFVNFSGVPMVFRVR